MSDNSNVVDINTGEAIDQEQVNEMSNEVQSEVTKNKFRFNKVGILEATFNPLKRSEHFSSLIQDLHYTRVSDKTTDLYTPEMQKAA